MLPDRSPHFVNAKSRHSSHDLEVQGSRAIMILIIIDTEALLRDLNQSEEPELAA